MLDDRLDGKELEWARDHLRRCESCRERVEDFREILLRVGRLPKAPIASGAMDQAFEASIPEGLRGDPGRRSFEVAPPDETRVVMPSPEPPMPVLPEVTSIPDLMSELEREIFHDEPAVDHPAPLTSPPPPAYASDEPMVEEEEIETVPPGDEARFAPFVEPAAEPEPTPVAEPAATAEPAGHEAFLPPTAGAEADAWREVPIDSHHEAVGKQWDGEPEPAAMPQVAETPGWPPARALPVVETTESEPAPTPPVATAPTSVSEAKAASDTPAPQKSDGIMRVAVGLGAAACVLLAAVLYEGGRFLPGNHLLGSSTPASSATHASVSARPSPSPSATPVATVPPANVLFTFNNGATGGTVFRIRPGTAVAGLTRLVFDIHGPGLPSMLVTQPDQFHLMVIFKATTASGVPVNGIRSYHVSAVEPGVQQGNDGSITIDLARPVRVNAFTLPATGSYAWRLVVDIRSA